MLLVASIATACSSGSTKSGNPQGPRDTTTVSGSRTTTSRTGDPPRPAQWKLVFHDEFNQGRLDLKKWATCYWWSSTTCTNSTSQELELYRPQNVSVKQGMLDLTARKETVQGDPANGEGKQFDYTSGIVTGASPSATLFSFKYGYVDARARIPAGQGLWSAFWMLPVDRSALPEVDIFEIFGQHPTVDNETTHWDAGGGRSQQLGNITNTPDLSVGWHDFGLEWDRTTLAWYLDGKEIWRLKRSETIPNTQMYLLADLAVGGSFGGPPNSHTVFPSSLVFDYVRVWQKR